MRIYPDTFKACGWSKLVAQYLNWKLNLLHNEGLSLGSSFQLFPQNFSRVYKITLGNLHTGNLTAASFAFSTPKIALFAMTVIVSVHLVCFFFFFEYPWNGCTKFSSLMPVSIAFSARVTQWKQFLRELLGQVLAWLGHRVTWAGSDLGKFSRDLGRFWHDFWCDLGRFSVWLGQVLGVTWAGSGVTWAGSRMTFGVTWAGSLVTWAGSCMTWAGSRRDLGRFWPTPLVVLLAVFGQRGIVDFV